MGVERPVGPPQDACRGAAPTSAAAARGTTLLQHLHRCRARRGRGARYAPPSPRTRPRSRFRHGDPCPTTSVPAVDIPALDRRLLEELEPEAGRLLDRHLKVAQEWFPHDYIPYRLGRDFDKEPWTPDQPRLTGVAQTAFEIGLLTEDNLPSYHRLIHGMFGQGDGAWLDLGRALDGGGGPPRDRAARLPHGHPEHRSGAAGARADEPAPAGLRPWPRRTRSTAWPTWRSRSWRPGSRTATPGATRTIPVADRIMVRIAADENLHMVFYRDILKAALAIEPSAAVRAIDGRGARLQDAGRRHPELPAQGSRHREGRHLRPARPPRRGPAADPQLLGRLRARAGSTRRPRRPAAGWRSTWTRWTRPRSGSRSGWPAPVCRGSLLRGRPGELGRWPAELGRVARARGR